MTTAVLELQHTRSGSLRLPYILYSGEKKAKSDLSTDQLREINSIIAIAKACQLGAQISWIREKIGGSRSGAKTFTKNRQQRHRNRRKSWHNQKEEIRSRQKGIGSIASGHVETTSKQQFPIFLSCF